jgi:malate/lactate dehydrogenase
MQVAVVGTGNVGSALLIHLVHVPGIDEILVMNIEDDWSKAAIMDAASANPDEALKLKVAPFARLGEPDIILMTSGAQMEVSQTGTDVLAANIRVMDAILDKGQPKASAIVIGLATPVDDITAHLQRRCGLPHPQVFGFGGDLDRNRLAYVLSLNRIANQGIAVVGEHGGNMIPVYAGEKDFDTIANRVRFFLRDITAQGGRPRNLATGLLMAKLVESIVTDANRVHFVCGYHPVHQLHLTWPYRIGRKGVLQPEAVRLFPQGEKALRALIAGKKK